MKQLFPRGKRIRPTDKDLVFYTALASLLPVFLLVVLLFHIGQIAGTNWQEVSLSQIVQDVNIPYLLFSMGVAGLVCLTAVVEYAPIYFCTDTWNHSFTGILPTNSEIWTKSLNNCTIITGRIPRNPKIILFQVTADHIRIPVYIAVDAKLVPCCLYNFPERICQLMNALCSKSSLIVIFQVKPYRSMLQQSASQHDL